MTVARTVGADESAPMSTSATSGASDASRAIFVVTSCLFVVSHLLILHSSYIPSAVVFDPAAF